MQQGRIVNEVMRAKPTREGAGVRLKRGFGYFEIPRFDPFLMLDDFSSPNPADYLAGFPWHPHRGIETVTYILDGDVRHRDSMGNAGVIGAGDVQWMTAGSGIIHEEMPEGAGGIAGFQLWVNLPKDFKMMTPRYQEVKAAAIPDVPVGKFARAKVIAGAIGGGFGPVENIIASPLYVDVTLEEQKELEFPLVSGHTALIYIVSGALGIGAGMPVDYEAGVVVLLNREGDNVLLRAGNSEARFLIISGKPIGEPVAWRGPIVMNSDDELRAAFQELENGTFVRKA
jgi:quercetin 2,3-dioxygenase